MAEDRNEDGSHRVFWERGARGHRIDREIRFIQRQRRKREWISFREIAEWLSEINGRGVPNETARDNAYNMLQHDLLAGQFEEAGRSMVLYLHPATPMGRMTPERLQSWLDTFPVERVRSAYLGRCWIPRRMFDRWLAFHEHPPSPARFALATSESSAASAAAYRNQLVAEKMTPPPEVHPEAPPPATQPDEPAFVDPRSRDQVLTDYFKDTLKAGKHPTQKEAEEVPGAPKGNKNAFKHGHYSVEAIAARREIAALLWPRSTGRVAPR
jgi:hypothetical protein